MKRQTMVTTILLRKLSIEHHYPH